LPCLRLDTKRFGQIHNKLLIDTIDFSINSVQTSAYKDTDHPSRKTTKSKRPISDAFAKEYIHASLLGYGSRSYNIDGASCDIPYNYNSTSLLAVVIADCFDRNEKPL
jgi:hypothetical protein